MSQYDNPYAQSEAVAAPAKTSGLAITALVFSLVGIVPCLGLLTAPIGALLGLIGAATIGSKPGRKGKGMAITALFLGLVFSAAQGYGAYWFGNLVSGWMELVMRGPHDALEKGFAGDVAGFKAEFYGKGATATDEEAQAFLDELRARYGGFISAGFDETGGQPTQPAPGQANVPFPYLLEFDQATLKGETEIIFADPNAGGGFINKLGYIKVFDPDLGDLTYPPGE